MLVSHVLLSATPWSVAHQAPLSMEFSRQEYQSRLPCPPPGDLPGTFQYLLWFQKKILEYFPRDALLLNWFCIPFTLSKHNFVMFLIWRHIKLDFPGDWVVKNLPANAGDTRDVSLVPGLGRSSGGGNGNPGQYSCLEKIHKQRSLMGVHGVAKIQIRQDWAGTHIWSFHGGDTFVILRTQWATSQVRKHNGLITIFSFVKRIWHSTKPNVTLSCSWFLKGQSLLPIFFPFSDFKDHGLL